MTNGLGNTGSKKAISANDLANIRPTIPARPVLSWDALGSDASHSASVLDVGQVKYTINARSALALALWHAKLGPGCSVLLPAYHCPAMVSPIVWLGAEPIFYPVSPDTTVDTTVLAGYVRADTRVLLAVHYFGFIQDFSCLRKFCDEHGLVLIEDCAHAFFGHVDGHSLGRWGDYAIASIMKFLPVYEGGCLVSSKHSLTELKLRHGGLFFQLKSLLNNLEMACEYGRLPWLNNLLNLKGWLWQRVKSPIAVQYPSASLTNFGEGNNEDYIFDSEKLGLSMSLASMAILKLISFSRACEYRRVNYKLLFNALYDVPGARPLYPHLPEGVYPQVFPMLIDEPEEVFPLLKMKGVPIIRFGEFRWEGVDGEVCQVSDNLSRRVFQFPCHQSLTGTELDWMARAIVSALRGSTKQVASNSEYA